MINWTKTVSAAYCQVFTDQEAAAVIWHHYQQGKSLVSLAKDLRVSYTSVGTFLKTSGYQLRSKGGRNNYKPCKGLTLEMAKEHSLSQLANQFGVSRRTIKNRLAELEKGGMKC